MRKVFLFVLIPKKRPSPVAATESKVRVRRLLWIMCQARCTTVYLIVLPHGFLYHTFLYRRSSHLANLPGTYSSAVTAELSIGDKKKMSRFIFGVQESLKGFLTRFMLLHCYQMFIFKQFSCVILNGVKPRNNTIKLHKKNLWAFLHTKKSLTFLPASELEVKVCCLLWVISKAWNIKFSLNVYSRRFFNNSVLCKDP